MEHGPPARASGHGKADDEGRGRSSTILCCGDTAPPAFRRVVRSIAERSPEVVLFAGDARAHAFGMGRMAAGRWRRTWGALADRVITVPGNHDYEDVASPGWRWSGAWPAHGGFRAAETVGAFVLHLPRVSILGLDTGPRADAVGVDQLEWARSAMRDADPDNHRIALFHAPAFPVSGHIGSSLDARPEGRDALWAALEDLGIQLVVNGHEHLYARRTVSVRVPIVQIVTGGGGAPLMPALSADVTTSRMVHHAVLLRVSRERLHGEAFEPDGAVLDTFVAPRVTPPAAVVERGLRSCGGA